MNIKIILSFFLFLLGNVGAASILLVNGPHFITQNQTWEITQSNGFDIGAFENRLGGWNPKHRLSFYAQTPTHTGDWDITFASTGGSSSASSESLTTGVYIDLPRLEKVDSYSFSITGNGRGSNASSTILTVLQLEWNADDTPKSVAIDFTTVDVDYSGNKEKDWLMGSFRYNSDIPVSSVPEPTISLFCGLVALVSFKRKR